MSCGISRPSRRQLLGRSAGAVLAAGVWSSARLLPARSALERLRVASIGVGNRGETNTLEAAGEELVALCDVDQRYLDQRSQRFPDARCYADFRELFAEERELDAVIISTPDHTHSVAARWALSRRLHVYCEKPLVHSLGELSPLLAAARRAGTVTQTGIQHHSSDGYRQARAWLAAGVLGPVTAIHAWTDRPFWPQGGALRPRPVTPPLHLSWDLWLGPAAARPYSPEYHPMNWRGYWDFGSGALGDRGPHLLDPVIQGLNLPAPQEVRATSSRVTGEMAPEWSRVEMDFRRGAAEPPLRLTWYDGGQQPPREVTRVERLPPNGCLVVGAAGRLFIPELGGPPRLLFPAGKLVPEPPQVAPEETSHVRAWLGACRAGTPASTDFEYGARLTLLCLLGNLALRRGRPLRWDGERQTLIDAPDVAAWVQPPQRPGWEPPG